MPTARQDVVADGCRDEYAPFPKRDPNPMCRVDGGTFAFGTSGVQVTVPTFYIDQFEVSQEQAAAFLNSRGGNLCPIPGKPSTDENVCFLSAGPPLDDILEEGGAFQAAPKTALHSVVLFSQQAAVEYCAWAGKQVPSSAMWEYAARHDPKTGRDYLYPWGDKWDATRVDCPYCERPRVGSQPPRPQPIGTFNGRDGHGDGRSPWGAHDMFGGAPEMTFACTDPNETCSTALCSGCRIALTPGFEEPLDELNITSRHDMPRSAMGLRCMRTAEK